MSDCNVDHLLLLHLERGQIYRKGEFFQISFGLENCCISESLSMLVMLFRAAGGVFHSHLPLLDAVSPVDPWTHTSWCSSRDRVLSHTGSISTHRPSGRSM